MIALSREGFIVWASQVDNVEIKIFAALSAEFSTFPLHEVSGAKSFSA